LVRYLDVLEQDRNLAEVVARESGRLRRFIQRRVSDMADAEDILQDVLFELVESTRVMHPIEQVGAWLIRVARNRIIDRFRARRHDRSTSEPAGHVDGEPMVLEDLLPSSDGGPEAAYARGILLDELEAALDELPAEQRFVFVAHEIEGRPFKDLAAETGLSVNTLLARKHYAVRRLRRRLQAIHAMIQDTGGGRR
jgi:RNA polymerase sigma factor (sigma-70 family)